ncbi:VOC family protein [Paracoccus sp. MC1862]|uniref:VOC family protein n=1 Tax=Paracoccus sp. MC1862 TaxID=2760307 RepID=UPI001602ACF4|nr:VOC family protein [Paracoccus sp. MC1862]MBB1497595.1 VOC family protein [Paracoccus sp. MC1862]QQO44042.1 VOC family protein [Paracoccus sp. MC1862]
MTRLIPHLWYNSEAEEAARFYASVIPDSRIDHVTTMPIETPSGPPGSVTIVEFTLAGQPMVGFTGGPMDTFNHAISLMVECDTQGEIDRIWDALLDGGAPEQCGWLRDRWGVAWQIAPKRLAEMMRSNDRAAAARTAQAMMGMVKLDLAELERAFAG